MSSQVKERQVASSVVFGSSDGSPGHRATQVTLRYCARLVSPRGHGTVLTVPLSLDALLAAIRCTMIPAFSDLAGDP